MKYYCSHCNNEFYTENDDKVIYFPDNKGILCRKCFEHYDLLIKEIEYKFEILRGFKKRKE